MNTKKGPMARHTRFKMVRLPYEVFDLGRSEDEALVVAFPPGEAWGFLFTRDDYGAMRLRKIEPNINRAALQELPLLCKGKHPNCGTPHGDAAHAFMASVPGNVLHHFMRLLDAEEAGVTARRPRSKSIRY